MTPSEIHDYQRAITDDPAATRRVLRYLDRHGIEHSGQITGGTLARLCRVHPRTWRKWAAGERDIPETAVALLRLVARV